MPWRAAKAVFSEDRIETEQRLRRFRVPPIASLFSLWGLFILFMALKGMTRDFTGWVFPVWEMELGSAVFITLFLLFWYGFAIFWIWMTARPVHTVRVSRDWVKFCIGPVVFRKIAVCDIATVVITEEALTWNPNGRYYDQQSGPTGIYLSRLSDEELRERSMDRSTRRRKRKQELHISDSSRGKNSDVATWMAKRPMGRKWYLDWSESAEQALRENLTTSVFIK